MNRAKIRNFDVFGCRLLLARKYGMMCAPE